MWWMWFQVAVVFAVVGSNIQWQWTDNPTGAAFVGWVVAALATGYIVKWQNSAIERRGRAGSPQPPR